MGMILPAAYESRYAEGKSKGVQEPHLYTGAILKAYQVKKIR